MKNEWESLMQSANEAYTVKNLAVAIPTYYEALALAQAQFDAMINTHADKAVAKVVTCFLNIANANMTIKRNNVAIRQYNKCLFFLNQQMARKDLNEAGHMAILRAYQIFRLDWLKISKEIARDPMMRSSVNAVESRLKHHHYCH